MSEDSDGGVDRRAFMKSALAIGGSSALAACLQRSQTTNIPKGPSDLSKLPERQHAWNAFSAKDKYGNSEPVKHRLLLLLDYKKGGTPSMDDRSTLTQALNTLDHAYEWSHDGLLSTMTYSPHYFDRYQKSLPTSVDLPAPKALAPFENPTLDTPDALLYLASDHVHVLLAAEQALKGKKKTLNGVNVKAALTDVFSISDRRTGFKGGPLPSQHQDTGGVPDSKPVPKDAQLYMGFKSSYTKAQASEDRVTIKTGPFKHGSTMHASHMTLNLDQWYGQDDRYQRVGKMYCPYHAKNNVVEGTGENLGKTSEMKKAKPAQQAAEEDALVGHSQKMFSVRENGRPIILRRDFDSTDGGHAGLHFVAFQEKIADFVKTRHAMNGTKLSESTAVGQRNNNGILQYLDVTNRGNYLAPPRSLRAFPTPGGTRA